MKKIMLVYLLSLSAFVQTASFKAKMRQARLASQVDQLLLLLRNIASENLDRNFQAPEHSRAQQPQMHQGGGGGGAKEDDAERAQRLGFDADKLRGYGLDEKSINQQREQFLRNHKRQQEHQQEQERQRQRQEEDRQRQEAEAQARAAQEKAQQNFVRNLIFKTMTGESIFLGEFDLSRGYDALLNAISQKVGYRYEIVHLGNTITKDTFNQYRDDIIKNFNTHAHNGFIVKILSDEEKAYYAEQKRQQEQERQRQRQEEDRQRQEAEAQARAAQEKAQRERAAQQQSGGAQAKTLDPIKIKRYFDSIRNKTMTRVQALEILGLNKNATDAEAIKTARKLTRVYHPDKNTNKSENEKLKLKDQFALINAVFELFLNKGVDGKNARNEFYYWNF